VSSQQRESLLRDALALAAIGLAPVPMNAHGKRPIQKGWQELVSLDAENIAANFSSAPHADGLAIATGNGFFVVDLDRNHSNGADGVATFAGLIARHKRDAPIEGPRVRTPAGGLHLYFSTPAGVVVRNKAALAPGVDIRGRGGLALAPPSSRDGVPYRWITDPWTCPIPPAPPWLIDLISPRASTVVLKFKPNAFSGNLGRYARAALESECAAVANCAPGARNATLFKAAASLGSLAAVGAVPVQTVAQKLLWAASVCGLVAEDGRRATEATIASGLMRGLAQPRSVRDAGQ